MCNESTIIKLFELEPYMPEDPESKYNKDTLFIPFITGKPTSQTLIRSNGINEKMTVNLSSNTSYMNYVLYTKQVFSLNHIFILIIKKCTFILSKWFGKLYSYNLYSMSFVLQGMNMTSLKTDYNFFSNN